MSNKSILYYICILCMYVSIWFSLSAISPSMIFRPSVSYKDQHQSVSNLHPVPFIFFCQFISYISRKDLILLCPNQSWPIVLSVKLIEFIDRNIIKNFLIVKTITSRNNVLLLNVHIWLQSDRIINAQIHLFTSIFSRLKDSSLHKYEYLSIEQTWDWCGSRCKSHMLTDKKF